MNHDEAHGLRVQLATALRERDMALQRNGVLGLEVMKLRAELEAMKDRDYEPIKKWIQKDAPDAVRRAYAIMVTAESERDAIRGEVKRLRDSAAALRDGYDHVAHCRECGEMSVEHCAKAEGENSDAAKAIAAREAIDAALASGGDRP